MFILKIFLWILCINMQNCSNSKEIMHKSCKNLQKISKLVQGPANQTRLSQNGSRWANLSRKVLYMKSCVFSKASTWHWSCSAQIGGKWSKMGFRDFIYWNIVEFWAIFKFEALMNTSLRGRVVIAFRSNSYCFWEIWADPGSIPLWGTWFFFFVQIIF